MIEAMENHPVIAWYLCTLIVVGVLVIVGALTVWLGMRSVEREFKAFIRSQDDP